MGEMAHVWRGWRLMADESRQTVAIKRIKGTYSREPEAIQRFDHVRLCRSWHHTNVIACLDYIKKDGERWLVLEYIGGLSLQDLRERTQLSPEAVRTILLDALNGLEYIHNRGVLHRDLSPANIMISRDGIVTLVDFGLAKELDQPRSTAGFRGTAAYASYEALDSTLDKWSHFEARSLRATSFHDNHVFRGQQHQAAHRPRRSPKRLVTIPEKHPGIGGGRSYPVGLAQNVRRKGQTQTQ